MLVRLLIVLMFVGPPAPHVCTCAAHAAGGDFATPTIQEAPPSKPHIETCPCGGHHSEDSDRMPPAPLPSPLNHAPDCPVCQAREVAPALAPSLSTFEPDKFASISIWLPPESSTSPSCTPRSHCALSPHVPLFLTLLVLRN
ncbi:MAG: hypothetical protein L0241_31800 [Planctomycetia bacterium]|nr:hypothetical protein [Planctomycetia bacterium]